MEELKHECGVALVRLRKPLDYYKQKYGTYSWGLDKLYLLMEKQHNRGQEAAGVGVVNLDSPPGCEYVFRERALGSDAISKIFDKISRTRAEGSNDSNAFIGQINIGHLRYSTTGHSGMSYVHPFLRRNNWRSRNLLLCGNFNLTNVDEIFNDVVAQGQHPRLYSDTILLLEQIGYALDKENHRLYRKYRNTLTDPILAQTIEANIDMSNVLNTVANKWDGGFVICGATGSGDMFVVRDRNGIRPAFYYCDDEVIVAASERPVIQTVFDVNINDVHELDPGKALLINKFGVLSVSQILSPGKNARCSFERIYFSRGSDSDIYNERKQLGRNLVEPLIEKIGDDFDNTVFSFIPNTAEVAFMGLTEELENVLNHKTANSIIKLQEKGQVTYDVVSSIISKRLRLEKVVLKDIKLRTFITEGDSRDDLVAHVYDVTYGIVRKDIDTLVVIDDSIVRGTTLKQSILRMLGRLHPRRIIILSSSPQVRYPDYYGIDMSRMAEFCAFRAAVALVKESHQSHLLDDIYNQCRIELTKPARLQTNAVKRLYEQFSDEQISTKIAEMLTPPDVTSQVEILFQSLKGLHDAVPNNPGDWYFSGDYPTPGGIRLVNRAFVNYYEGNHTLR